MPKIAIVLLVILATSVVQVVVDKAMGIDLSKVSFPKRIVHNVTYKLAGAGIAAAIWFA